MTAYLAANQSGGIQFFMISGSIQVKKGNCYAVLVLPTSNGKTKIKWVRNYAEIIDTFHFLKHASILYF